MKTLRRILTISRLTWKAAFRYRLFWVLSALLIAAVVVLPLIIKGDGTAQGLTQILLTYTLSAITGLLGFSTLWLACGALARDVEECQIQMVSVKPIARWEIWIGKWVGILGLNAALLVLSGSSVFVLLNVRANRLSPSQQAILREQVFVARSGVKPPPIDVTQQAERLVDEQIKNKHLAQADADELRRQITARLKAGRQVVPSGYARRWDVDLGPIKELLRDKPLRMRVRFRSPDPNPAATYDANWRIGFASGITPAIFQQTLPPDSFQEFSIPPNLFDSKGMLAIEFFNDNQTALLFPEEDGIEVLYEEGTFGLNFVRGLGIIFCWLALLSAIGLAAASALSFPVAAFFSLAVMVLCFSTSLMSSVVEVGAVFGSNHETGEIHGSAIDRAIIPLFQGTLAVIKLARAFSPVDSLSTGRSITWFQLWQAFSQIVLLLGGMCCLIGILLFNRRELAAAQGNS